MTVDITYLSLCPSSAISRAISHRLLVLICFARNQRTKRRWEARRLETSECHVACVADRYLRVASTGVPASFHVRRAGRSVRGHEVGLGQVEYTSLCGAWGALKFLIERSTLTSGKLVTNKRRGDAGRRTRYGWPLHSQIFPDNAHSSLGLTDYIARRPHAVRVLCIDCVC